MRCLTLRGFRERQQYVRRNLVRLTIAYFARSHVCRHVGVVNVNEPVRDGVFRACGCETPNLRACRFASREIPKIRKGFHFLPS
jgi:hypothetical protein